MISHFFLLPTRIPGTEVLYLWHLVGDANCLGQVEVFLPQALFPLLLFWSTPNTSHLCLLSPLLQHLRLHKLISSAPFLHYPSSLGILDTLFTGSSALQLLVLQTLLPLVSSPYVLVPLATLFVPDTFHQEPMNPACILFPQYMPFYFSCLSTLQHQQDRPGFSGQGLGDCIESPLHPAGTKYRWDKVCVLLSLPTTIDRYGIQ